MAFPIAVQVYSVRDVAEQDLYGALKKIKEMGYDGVEFAGLYGHTADEVKGYIDELGLIPISAHVPYAAMSADPEGVLSDYAKIGCQYVAIPYLEPDYVPGGEKYPEMLKNAKILSATAKKLGMGFLYHNHDFEFAVIDGQYKLDRLYTDLTPEEIETELDTCWVNVGGENPAAFVRKYAGRTPIVHLKDFYGEKSDDMYELIGIEKKEPKRPGGFEFRPCGKGLQNFPEILAAAKDAGAKWVIVEQDNPSLGMNSMESIQSSIEYLKTINL